MLSHMAEMDNVVLGSKGFLFILETMGPPKNLLVPHFLEDTNRKQWVMANNVNPNLDQRMSRGHFKNIFFWLIFFLRCGCPNFVVISCLFFFLSPILGRGEKNFLC